MYKEKIASFFSSGEGTGGGLPSWAKGILAVGGAAVVFFVIRGILKKVKEQSETKENRQTVIQQNQEKKDLENQGMKLTYPKSQYKAWADALENEFSGCDPFNKSRHLIFEITDKIKNDLDFLELQTAFNIRKYDQCGWGAGDITANLPKAINDELNAAEIEVANNRLKSKGIKYTWA